MESLSTHLMQDNKNVDEYNRRNPHILNVYIIDIIGLKKFDYIYV